MKKFLSIVSAALLFASTSLFTACSTEDELGAPTNTWVEKTYTYKDSNNNSSQLTCYFMYSESGYSNSNLQNVPSDSQNGSATTIKPGLTVVIVPSTDSNSVSGTIANTLANNKFICKTFTNGTNSETDSSDSSTFSFTMSAAKWNLFYYANLASFLANDQLKNPPTPLKSSSYSELTLDTEELKKQFSWKRLLANYLLGSL
ncbi:MAG: hypothetical protein K5873_04325 [Treponema sp.]|nr:hypothetical protein [Treponema sp.]